MYGCGTCKICCTVLYMFMYKMLWNDKVLVFYNNFDNIKLNWSSSVMNYSPPELWKNWIQNHDKKGLFCTAANALTNFISLPVKIDEWVSVAASPHKTTNRKSKIHIMQPLSSDIPFMCVQWNCLQSWSHPTFFFVLYFFIFIFTTLKEKVFENIKNELEMLLCWLKSFISENQQAKINALNCAKYGGKIFNSIYFWCWPKY